MTSIKKLFYGVLALVTLLTGSLHSQAVNALAQNSHPTTASAALAVPVSDRGFVYALRNAGESLNNQIYGYFLNPTDGTLTALPDFPVATGGTGDTNYTISAAYVVPERLAYDSTFHRLYALNGNRTLSVFQVNPTTGALNAAPYSPISLGTTMPICLGIHPAGSIVVIGETGGLSGSGSLRSYVISGSSAVQATGSPYNLGATHPSSCAFSLDGSNFYTGGGDMNNNLAGFSVDTSSGVLTALSDSPFDSGSYAPQAFVTDNAGRLFVSHGTLGSTGQRAYTTSSGIPSGVSGNPFAPTFSAGSAVMHPAGFYIIANRGSYISDSDGLIQVFQVSGTAAGTILTHVTGSPYATGGKVSISVSLSGKGGFLLAANAASRNLTVFSINPSTGALTQLTVQAADTLGNAGRLNGIAFASQTFYNYLPNLLK